MANVAHASLTGTNLHEPKGVATATSGQAYIANGAGSGVWTNIATASFTGMIADFPTPIPPSGWLELDGTDISATTFAPLYNVMTIQQNGVRTVGSPTITGVTTIGTAAMRPGYFVFGTGIASGTTILSVTVSTITMSANAASSGTSTVIVSPWLLNTGVIRLPNLTANGRFRRSRTATLHMGVAQADLLKDHTHSGSTGSAGSAHAHSVSITTSTARDPGTFAPSDHTHTGAVTNKTFNTNVAGGGGITVLADIDLGASGPGGAGHTHDTIGATGIPQGTGEGAHSHGFTSGNPDSGASGAETRPLTLVLMTCVKT